MDAYPVEHDGAGTWTLLEPCGGRRRRPGPGDLLQCRGLAPGHPELAWTVRSMLAYRAVVDRYLTASPRWQHRSRQCRVQAAAIVRRTSSRLHSGRDSGLRHSVRRSYPSHVARIGPPDIEDELVEWMAENFAATTIRRSRPHRRRGRSLRRPGRTAGANPGARGDPPQVDVTTRLLSRTVNGRRLTEGSFILRTGRPGISAPSLPCLGVWFTAWRPARTVKDVTRDTG